MGGAVLVLVAAGTTLDFDCDSVMVCWVRGRLAGPGFGGHFGVKLSFVFITNLVDSTASETTSGVYSNCNYHIITILESETASLHLLFNFYIARVMNP